MTPWFLLGAGMLAGAMNAMAGGGSFVTLPAMIAAGLPSVEANTSSTVALYPGGLLSAWVYRDGLKRLGTIAVIPAVCATLLGGLLGALLLLWTPASLLDRVLPFLLLVATLVLAFGPRLGPALRARFRPGLASVILIQLGLGVYGGYFGGAVGLMITAVWGLLDGADPKTLNPLRTLLVSAANTVAMLSFVLAGAVRWPETLLLGAGALAGGYFGALVGARLPARAVRLATILFAASITMIFFARAWA